MGYFILQQDPRIPNQASVLRCPPSVDPERWIEGRELDDPGPLAFAMSPESGSFRGCIIGGVVTFFHKVLIDELARLQVHNLQTFPAALENPAGIVETAYSLVNVLGLLEAVDERTSVIKPRASGGRGQLLSFNIDPAKANGQRMFRLAEAPTLIIVDEALREELLAFNPPGVLMLPTDRYDGWG